MLTKVLNAKCKTFSGVNHIAVLSGCNELFQVTISRWKKNLK